MKIMLVNMILQSYMLSGNEKKHLKKKKCNAENIDISGIIKDGFFISEISNRRESIAYYSLISSLKAFFLTAEDLEKHYYGYENVYKQNEKDIDISYVVDACNSITHFQPLNQFFKPK